MTDRESEILDSNRTSGGSRALQTGLFVFACLGFIVKLSYSLYMYVQLSRDSAHFVSDPEMRHFINYMKWLSIGIFLHCILLFAGSLFLLLRRRAGAWIYLTGQAIFIIVLFFQFTYNSSFFKMSTEELLVFAAFIALPAACIVLNIITAVSG